MMLILRRCVNVTLACIHTSEESNVAEKITKTSSEAPSNEYD